MKVSNINCSNSAWQDIFNTARHLHFFQSPQWSKCLCTHIQGLEPAHLLFEFDNDIKFIFPQIRKRHIKGLFYSSFSLPLGTFGGFAGKSIPDDFQFSRMSKTIRKKPSLKTIINPCPGTFMNKIDGFNKIERKTFIVKLDEEYENIESYRFKKSRREAVGRARRRGVIVINSKTSEKSEAFLSLSKKIMYERKWATKYSDNFIHEILSFPQTDLWTSWYKGKLASGIITFCHNLYATAWLGAMDRSIQESQAMSLLKAEMMRHYQKMGCSCLDLGSSMGIKSLESYKLSFGCETVNIPGFISMNLPYKIYSSIFCKR